MCEKFVMLFRFRSQQGNQTIILFVAQFANKGEFAIWAKENVKKERKLKRKNIELFT